jgi:outer membrane protein OmpA-like peptidoglycan-associated protein
MRHLSLLFLFLLMIIPVRSKDYVNIGVNAGYGANLHSADFRALPGFPNCCPKFTGGNGSGADLAFIFEFPITNYLHLGADILMQDNAATLKEKENTFIYYKENMVNGSFEHIMDAKISQYIFRPKVKWNFLDNLFCSLGFGIGFINDKSFNQEERVSSSKGQATFVNEFGQDSKSAVRNKLSGDLPSLNSVLYSLALSLSYELPISAKNDFKIAPKIDYAMGLNSISEKYSWKVNKLSFGLSLFYCIETYNPNLRKTIDFHKIDTIRINSSDIAAEKFVQGIEFSETNENMKKDTLIIANNFYRTDTLYIPKKFELNAEFSIKGINENGRSINLDKIVGKKYEYSVANPLLAYIFFDKNSAVINARLKLLSAEETSKFNTKELIGANPLESYKQILNTIGYRLKLNRKANLKITGYNSGIDEESSNTKLSKQRAQNIANYLKDIWGIESGRISIEAKNLPDKASTPANEKLKSEENQRVELKSDYSDILEPLIFNDTLIKVIPEKIRVLTTFKSEAGLKEWKINLFSQTDETKALEIASGAKSFTTKDVNIGEIINKNYKNFNFNGSSISISLKDKQNGAFNSKPIDLNINLVSNEDKSQDGKIDIKKYSLILFDFTSDKIAAENETLLALIRKQISPNSRVIITGYTDITGNDKSNKTLAKQRAETVANALNIKDLKYECVAAGEKLYDNSIPEGRFLSRTVEVIIETPKNL